MVDVVGVPVFVKRIPITDRELEHPHDTGNLFDLPVACQYGMHPLAGPGFGAWRELAANLTVTEGVLAGESECFALLHHWRVLPGRPPVADEHRDVEAVVAQFGGDPRVRTRFKDLAEARYSLVLFLEHLPGRLPTWLGDPVGRAEDVERHLLEAVAFLRGRDLLHMDGHFGNMRADDERVYLVDFGLATSPSFELSGAERDFVAGNAHHDADYAAMRLVHVIVDCCTRQAAGCTVDVRTRTTEATGCVEAAVLTHAIVPEQLTLGTDNGSQFTSRDAPPAPVRPRHHPPPRRLPRPRIPGEHLSPGSASSRSAAPGAPSGRPSKTREPRSPPTSRPTTTGPTPASATAPPPRSPTPGPTPTYKPQRPDPSTPTGSTSGPGHPGRDDRRCRPQAAHRDLLP